MFFFSLISYNIFSLCQKHTHMSRFRLCFLLQRPNWMMWGKNDHIMMMFITVETSQEWQPRWWVEFTKWQRWELQNKQYGSGAVTTDTWSIHIPERFPSPQSTRCRQCSGKTPSSFCSWWRHSKHRRPLEPGRIWSNPCEESCWWTCMFSLGRSASAALLPSLLDMWALDSREGDIN